MTGRARLGLRRRMTSTAHDSDDCSAWLGWIGNAPFPRRRADRSLVLAACLPRRAARARVPALRPPCASAPVYARTRIEGRGNGTGTIAQTSIQLFEITTLAVVFQGAIRERDHKNVIYFI